MVYRFPPPNRLEHRLHNQLGHLHIHGLDNNPSLRHKNRLRVKPAPCPRAKTYINTYSSHPTSTMYCPVPSKGMTCGLDSNIIAPIDQGEDWSIEHYYNPEECQQVCLDHPLCKAYRVDGSAEKGWHCEIFNVGLGVNGSNVISAKPGTQWWDRNCQEHVPVSFIAVIIHMKGGFWIVRGMKGANLIGPECVDSMPSWRSAFRIPHPNRQQSRTYSTCSKRTDTD